MPLIPARIKGLRESFASIAADLFVGRFGWITDISRVVWYYTASTYAILARTDVLETFAGGIQDSTLTSGQPLVAGASGRIQSQDAATFRGTIGASPEYPFIVFPAPDPVRNHVDISVPDDGEFIDNVLAIQNKSHGLFFGVETWGNAAINFKDSAGTERCAVGYSRNSAIQPTGYIADTLYCEIGNPFTSDAQATYFRVMATIKAGSPYWGGAAKQWAPVVISSRTGRIDLDAGGGGQAVNVINGPLTVGERDDVQPLNIELTNSAARIREFAWSDYLGITTNLANLAPPYTLDDNAKSAWILGLGYGSGAGEFDSLQVKRVPAGGGSATTLFRVSSSGVIQASNLSGTGSRPLVADASGNIASGVGSEAAVTVVQNVTQTPPGSPVTGAPYLVATGATGAWAGQDDKLATWNGSAWVFTVRPVRSLCYSLTTVSPVNSTFASGVEALSATNIWATGLVYANSDLQSGNLAGTGDHPIVADSTGKIKNLGTVTREMQIQSLPITNAAPGVVTVGPSGSMKSFGFDGGTQVEELFYHIDTNHDYIAGTDIIPHAHWVQATNGTGTVRFKFDVLWVQAGGAVGAPVAYDCADVNVNGTAWAAEQRSETTVSGAGKTYNSRILLRLYRDPSLDTYTGDAVLTSIGVHYSANPLQVG